MRRYFPKDYNALHFPKSAASIFINYLAPPFPFSLGENFFFLQIGRTEPPKPGQIASGGGQSVAAAGDIMMILIRSYRLGYPSPTSPMTDFFS